MFPNWINFVFDKQHLSAKKSKGRSQSLKSKSVQVCGEFLVDIVTVELVGSHWVQHVTYYMKATSFWALRRALFTRIYRKGPVQQVFARCEQYERANNEHVCSQFGGPCSTPLIRKKLNPFPRRGPIFI